MTEIKAMSEGEHIIEVEKEFLESADLSPHVTIINHEPPVVSVVRDVDYNDGLNKVDK